MTERLSVVLITINEGHHIAKCLKAAQAVADEIIVIDSGSTDDTVEVCKAYGARVITHPWCGYSEQKNFGNKHASFDWILSLDADEVLNEALIQSILKWKHAPQSACFKRMTNYCGTFIKHGGWYPDVKVRLFNKQETNWKGTIHEVLRGLSKENTFLLEGDCLHYSYYSVDQHYAQAEKFTSIQAEDLFQQGKKSSWFKRVFSPISKFVVDYFFRLGFLDGKAGFTVARISAYATFLKYKKLNEHIRLSK
ncbi:MAG: glycosyltransferase family 2 protein [Sediminibacterium sp.]